MSSQTPDIKRRFEELSTGAQLDTLVPASADFDPTSLFHDGLPGRLSSAPSRRNIYFDENTTINLILRTSLGERAVRSMLPSLQIALTAHATDAVPQGQGNAASAFGKHDLTSKTIAGLGISSLLFAGEQTYVFWKATLHIPRPRARLQRPAVYFTASISLTADTLHTARTAGKDILRSFEPLPANVLEPLQFDPALAGSDVYLPEDRITKVLPASPGTKDAVKPIRGATTRAFPVAPALHTRVRYSTLQDAIIASLHVEASQLISGPVLVQGVSLKAENADVQHLVTPDGSDSLSKGDESVYLYKLLPKQVPAASSTAALSVQIQATLLIEQDASVDLDIGSHAQIDLSRCLAKSTYKWSRPLSGGPLHLKPRTSMQAGSRSSSEVVQTSSVGQSGMTFNFTARPTVTRGEDFKLDVHCVNRSNRSRRFALVMLQPKRTHSTRTSQDAASERADLVASIFNAPTLERTKPSEVLDMNPDTRIGPLPPGAVYETQMSFRAVATGPLDLGVLRIVDLDTRQTIDVRELPDVIALQSSDEGTAWNGQTLSVR